MAKFSALKFLREQFITLPLVKGDLTGRVIIVVGANSGLGLEATRHLASMKPGRLILGCRSVEKGEAAIKEIKASTGCHTMEVWQVDLSSFASVRAFADRFEKEGGGKLDLLVENAGINVVDQKFKPTDDRYEKTLQVNHLSNALLAFLLLPYLSKSSAATPGPRIVVVASETHFQVPHLAEANKENIINALNDPSKANMAQRYNESKLLNIFFVRAFAQYLKDNPVAIDCLNPGFCHSELMRDATGFFSFAIKAVKAIIARSTEMGSRTIIAAALSSSNAEVQGKYMNMCQVEEESDYVIGEEGSKVQQRLWDETITILKDVDVRVGGIVHTYFRGA